MSALTSPAPQPPFIPRPGRPAQPLGPSRPLQPGQPAWPVWSLIGPALGGLLGAVLLTALISAEPTIGRALAASPGMLGGLAVGYLVAAAGGVAVGMFVGRRRPAVVVVPAMVVMLAGVVATALAPVVAVLLVGQVLTGLAAGAAGGTVVGLLPQLGRWHRRAALLLAIAVAVGLVFGLVLGWVTTVAFGWRLLYFVAMPFPLLAGAVTLVGGIARTVSRPAR